MTYNPGTLYELGKYWTSQGGVNLGVVGNTAHTVGYHLGRDRIYDGSGPGIGDNDYSVQHPRDKKGLTNAASAIDLGKLNGSLAELRKFSKWLVARCQSDATFSADVREIIYSPDGSTVQRWSGIDNAIHTGPGNGDSSHTTHTHISFFRDSEYRAKVPLFEPYFTLPPDTSTGDTEPMIEMGSKTPTTLDIAVGKQLYDLNAAPYVTVSKAQNDVPCPGYTKIGGVAYCLVIIYTGGSDKLLLVKKDDVTDRGVVGGPKPYPVKLTLQVGDKPVTVTTGPLTLP